MTDKDKEGVEAKNPNAKKMCSMCYSKDNCEQSVFDQIFCKLNQINWEIKKMRQGDKE